MKSTFLLYACLVLSILNGPPSVVAQNATNETMCSVCGPNSIVTEFDGRVIVPPFINVTCTELVDQVEMGAISTVQCAEITVRAQQACGCQFMCPLCGVEDAIISNPNGIIAVPDTSSNLTCGMLDAFASDGNLTRAQCATLQPFVSESCGCVNVTVGPTVPPTDVMMPTTAPASMTPADPSSPTSPTVPSMAPQDTPTDAPSGSSQTGCRALQVHGLTATMISMPVTYVVVAMVL